MYQLKRNGKVHNDSEKFREQIMLLYPYAKAAYEAGKNNQKYPFDPDLYKNYLLDGGIPSETVKQELDSFDDLFLRFYCNGKRCAVEEYGDLV